MDNELGNTVRQGQVQVHFVTDVPDIGLPEGKRQLLVPAGKWL
jgi:ribosome biogenesis protein